MKILNSTERDQVSQLLAGKTPDLRLRVQRASDPISVNQAERTIEFILSDENADHCGDIIRQAGWDMAVFAKNPVMPWCHDYEEPPIAKWEGLRVAPVNGVPSLLGMARYATAEIYDFADTIFKLSAGGFLRGVSVGFDPKEYQPIGDQAKGFSGWEFTKQVLWECSACTIPCNPNALARSVADGVISKRELVDLAVRRALAEIKAPLDVRTVLESEVLKCTLKQISDLATSLVDAAGSTPAPAAASPELARCLDTLAEIRAAFATR